MAIWRAFRRLPGAGQLAIVLAIAAAYTVGLVLLLGGGDEDGGTPKVVTVTADGTPAHTPTTPLEKAVARAIEGAPQKKSETGDVARFRRPVVTSVLCKGTACTAAYTSGLPGFGRLLEDQQQMLRRILVDTETDRLDLAVFRGNQAGTGVPLKSKEETPGGVALVQSVCDVRGKDLSKLDGRRIQATLCEVSQFRPGDSRRSPGQLPGSDG